MLIQVEGPAKTIETAKCFLQLTAHVVGGGTFLEDPPGNVRASKLSYRVP